MKSVNADPDHGRDLIVEPSQFAVVGIGRRSADGSTRLSSS